jgi:hypothetical protein
MSLARLAVSSYDAIHNSVQSSCTSACTNTSLNDTIAAIVNVLLFVAGAASLIMIVIGGLRYVVSGGNPSGTNDAKNTILYAVVGLVITVSAYAIVNYVLGSFNL